RARGRTRVRRPTPVACAYGHARVLSARHTGAACGARARVVAGRARAREPADAGRVRIDPTPSGEQGPSGMDVAAYARRLRRVAPARPRGVSWRKRLRGALLRRGLARHARLCGRSRTGQEAASALSD